MKKFFSFLLLISLFISCQIFAQEIEAKLGGVTVSDGFSVKDPNNNTLLRVRGDGNVGIGVVNPSKKLEVNGTLGWGTSGAVLNTDQGASIELRGTGTPYIDFSNTLSDYDIRLMLHPNNVLGIYGGSIGIGTNNTNGYKLAVAGSVVAEEIVVKLQQNWPDFVFKENYKKPDLSDVENYIKKHGHLPKIPDAEEITNKGVNIGEMQAKLLEKIEELTLYLIEQDKKIEKLEIECDLLKKKVEQN